MNIHTWLDILKPNIMSHLANYILLAQLIIATLIHYPCAVALMGSIKFPFKWCHYQNQPSIANPKGKHLKVKFLPSSRHFFTSDWINGHNSAILAPINFYLTPFYSSHASDSDGIWNNHVTQNGCREQELCHLDSIKITYMNFIASCQVNSCIHKKMFYIKRKVIRV